MTVNKRCRQNFIKSLEFLTKKEGFIRLFNKYHRKIWDLKERHNLDEREIEFLRLLCKEGPLNRNCFVKLGAVGHYNQAKRTIDKLVELNLVVQYDLKPRFRWGLCGLTTFATTKVFGPSFLGFTFAILLTMLTTRNYDETLDLIKSTIKNFPNLSPFFKIELKNEEIEKLSRLIAIVVFDLFDIISDFWKLSPKSDDRLDWNNEDLKARYYYRELISPPSPSIWCEICWRKYFHAKLMSILAAYDYGLWLKFAKKFIERIDDEA